MDSNSTVDSFVLGLNCAASTADNVSSVAPIAPSRAVIRKAATGERTRKRKIEKAVYSHIQAVRTLGRTKINTAEIADALSIPVSEVTAAIDGLKRKGVKVVA
jgi:hypothetical protein